jgi:hypothetical protein
MSHFNEALRLNHIKEVIVKGNVIEFRSSNSEWYKTIIGRFPVEEVYKAIKSSSCYLGIKI